MESRSRSRWSNFFVLDWSDPAVQELKLDPRRRHVEALHSKWQPPHILQDIEPTLTMLPTRPEPFICPPSQLPPFPPLLEFARPHPSLFTGILVAEPRIPDTDPFAKK
jgi:hypothetical protein